MPPIRFINLDRDTERRRSMEAEFERLNLQAERFAAVLWASLPAAEQDRLYSSELNATQFHKPLVNGEKGCYASHLALWQWLIDSSFASLVVLEDDVQLSDDFAAVCAAIEALPDDRWDMVKLIGRSALGKPEKEVNSEPLCANHVLQRYRRVPSLTAGYVISRRGAEKLLATRQPFGRPIDVDLRHWWESDSLRILGVHPSVLSLDETSLASSIGSKVPEASFGVRWRKFRHKFNYTLANAWHRFR